MGLFEPITHKEEIERLTSEAKSMYDKALNKFESQKRATTGELEKLGKIKIESWSKGMNRFVLAFDSFANVSMEEKINSNMSFTGSSVAPSTMLVNIQNASLTAGEIMKAGFAAVGTGALVGIASYGGAMMFGKASTGTAIAALSGAAKTNATLAWFGGGSKAIGGLGITGGKLIIAGIVAIPILAVGGIIACVKGKERLAEAKKIHVEAEDASEKLNIMTTEMRGIACMSANYSKFIKEFEKKFRPFIDELYQLKNKYTSDTTRKIDFNYLSIAEQKTVHLAWLMAQVYYSVLSTSILTDQGTVATQAGNVLRAATSDFKTIMRNVSDAEAPAKKKIWKSVATPILIVGFSVITILIIIAIILFSNV